MSKHVPVVLDASALLAYLKMEPGWQRVEEVLETGAYCSAANWSEVAQKVQHGEVDWDTTSSLLKSHPLSIEPVTEADAERAAQLWSPQSGLSLADRCCLALAERLEAIALTSDTAWKNYSTRVELIRSK